MTDAGGFAALIAEPIQGVGGFATPPDGFFEQRTKFRSNDILFISDEVQQAGGAPATTSGVTKCMASLPIFDLR